MSKTSHVLNVKPRMETGKSHSRRARRKGMIPGVVYGHGKENRRILIDDREMEAMLNSQARMVELKEESGNIINALIKDYQYDFLNETALHVDFQEINMDEIIRATVPVHPVGTPVGLTHGGIFEQVLHEIEVSCLPANLPERLEINVSSIGLEQSILVRDLQLPEGVTCSSDAGHVVFHVVKPAAEKEVVAEEVAEAEVADKESKEGGEK